MKTGSIILLLMLLLSCTKKSANGEEYVYSQTQCSDKWANGGTDEKTIQNMTDYLRTKGIELLSATLKKSSNDLIVCLACSCPTGRSFFVTVANGAIIELEKEGFRKAN